VGTIKKTTKNNENLVAPLVNELRTNANI